MKQDYMREDRFRRVQTTLLCGALIMVLLLWVRRVFPKSRRGPLMYLWNSWYRPTVGSFLSPTPRRQIRMGLGILWACSGMIEERSGEYLSPSVLMEPCLAAHRLGSGTLR